MTEVEEPASVGYIFRFAGLREHAERVQTQCGWEIGHWRKLDEHYVIQWFNREDPMQTPRWTPSPNRHVVVYAVSDDRHDEHVALHEAAGWLPLFEEEIRGGYRSVVWQSPRFKAIEAGEPVRAELLIPPPLPNDDYAPGQCLAPAPGSVPAESNVEPAGIRVSVYRDTYAAPTVTKKTSLLWFSDSGDGGFFDLPF